MEVVYVLVVQHLSVLAQMLNVWVVMWVTVQHVVQPINVRHANLHLLFSITLANALKMHQLSIMLANAQKVILCTINHVFHVRFLTVPSANHPITVMCVLISLFWAMVHVLAHPLTPFMRIFVMNAMSNTVLLAVRITIASSVMTPSPIPMEHVAVHLKQTYTIQHVLHATFLIVPYASKQMYALPVCSPTILLEIFVFLVM